jgi:hypothetical protein
MATQTFTNEEIWKDIKGYEGFYKINNMGQVKSLPRLGPHNKGGHRISKEKILKLTKTNFGYMRVQLYGKAQSKKHFVHRLVLTAFNYRKDYEDYQVNHINGVKTDNYVENLEWVTKQENIQHAYKLELNKGPISKKRPVIRIEDNKFFVSMCEAAKAINTDTKSIWNVCNFKRNHCKGWRFRYA